ncbi:MAG: ABC transporter ATP-binding protein [Candidatus Zixiibacteriota bacterium]|nr:MAG: ABC transporter ATP-binding protein [candidate division Zixibacteria bacterium]
MQSAYIHIQGLRKSFGEHPILKGVDIAINKGESIAVIGQSGCGKSVLLKHLIRLLEPDEGTVVFDNRDLVWLNTAELVEVRRRFGMLFQSAALFDSLTVEENVGLSLKEQRLLSDSEIHDKVMDKLNMVRLSSAADKYPEELSGGMKKRAGLARAIVNDPDVLLYDEPTTGLDPITADVINDMIVELHKKLNVTSVAVTHDMRSAFKIADRIVMLHDGRVEFDGSPEETRITSNPIVAQFIRGEAQGPIQER